MNDDRCGQAKRWRTAVSAMLDGELPVTQLAAVTEHLRGCPACAAWADRAAALTRPLRHVRTPAPNLGDVIIGEAEARACRCADGLPCTCSDCRCGDHCTCKADLPVGIPR